MTYTHYTPHKTSTRTQPLVRGKINIFKNLLHPGYIYPENYRLNYKNDSLTLKSRAPKIINFCVFFFTEVKKTLANAN